MGDYDIAVTLLFIGFTIIIVTTIAYIVMKSKEYGIDHNMEDLKLVQNIIMGTVIATSIVMLVASGYRYKDRFTILIKDMKALLIKE